MKAYIVRIMVAWVLLQFAKAVMKDAENHLQTVVENKPIEDDGTVPEEGNSLRRTVLWSTRDGAVGEEVA